MEIGLIITLLSAVVFAGGNVLTRKGVYHAGESFTGVFISIFVGVLFFALLTLFSGAWHRLLSLSWQGFTLLGVAGIIHFVLGRYLAYDCFRFIGVNRGSVILRSSNFYAVILGILFLKEPVTPFLVLAVLCVTAGVTLVSVERGDEVSKLPSRGVLAGLGGAFCWGTSGVLIKPVIEEIGSPLAAAFISYIAAFLVVAGFLFGRGQRKQLTQLHREALVPLVISAILIAVAQLLRYLALSYSPVSVVSPLIGTSSLFVFFLSFLLNRNIEVFSWRVFIGIVVTVVGTFLFFQ